MTGILVTNHFLHSEKTDILHEHLISTAKSMGITLRLRTNQQVICGDIGDGADFVLFWDKDTCAAKALQNRGIPVFNSAESIALCDDKAETYLALDGIVPQPRTVIAPLAFSTVDRREFLQYCADTLGTPFVLKDRCGSFGEQVWLCQNPDDAVEKLSGRPFLVQEYIECSNRDIRIEVVGNEVVAAMTRHNPNDFRANITNGGIAAPYSPTDEEIRMAVTACRALGLGFGGVDIIGGMVCEVNSNAHIINIAEATGVNVAERIFGYIMEKLS